MKNWKKGISILLAIMLIITGMPMQSKNVMAVENTVKNGLSSTEKRETTRVRSKKEVPEGYKAIRTMDDLYAIGNDMDGKYILMNDIDMSQATSPGGEYDAGNGWKPIGSDTNTAFSGILDGNGYRIKGMHIYGEINVIVDYKNRTVGIGLFSSCHESTYAHEDYDNDDYTDNKDNKIANIMNLGMVDVDIDIIEDIGAGGNDYISVGGIAGELDYGRITNCFVTGKIKVAGQLIHSNRVGGIVGNYVSSYEGSTAKGDIENCYSTALIENKNISSSGDTEWYGNATGGLVGESTNRKIDFVYNLGQVNDGQGDAIVGNSYYSGTSSFFLQGIGASNSQGTPMTDKQMRSASYFTNFDFKNTWMIDPYSNYPYPQLRSCPQIKVNSLELTSQPQKTVYEQGETLDLTGATVKLVYEDGLTQEVLLTDDMLGEYDMSKTGEQEIAIERDGQTASFKIEIKGISTSSVVLSKAQLSIPKGKSETLTASVLPNNATDQSITWSVVEGEGSDCVTVDNNGKVSALNRGTATVRATASNGVYAECIVFVEIPCVMLQLDHYDVTINKGQTVSAIGKIGCTMSPLDCTDTLQWKSSNEKVLSIDNEGNMTGYAAGSVTVTAITSSGVSALCTVTVLRNISEFTVLGLKNKEYTGKAIKQKLKLSDGTKTLRENIDYKLSYKSNVKVGTATVIITGISPYVGTIEKNFQIFSKSNNASNSLAKTKITKVVAGKQKLTVSWKKVNGATGYVIQVATNAKFTKGIKKYTVTASVTKKVCIKLQKKKKYYIRVAAKNNGGIGKYSSVKQKKTK